MGPVASDRPYIAASSGTNQTDGTHQGGLSPSRNGVGAINVSWQGALPG